jgi:hypothetical protein
MTTTHGDDLSARLELYARQLMAPGPERIDETEDSIDWYARRAKALGDAISRETIAETLDAWDRTRTRCCGFRANLPLGLCAACIRDGNVTIGPADAAALAESMWAIGNPTRAAIAKYVARELRAGETDPRYMALANRILTRPDA